jgi:hypothetical protein
LQGLRSCGNLTGIKFCYFISKNINLLKRKEREILEKLDDIKKEFAAKDEDGNPIIKDNQYDIQNKEGFNAKIKELMDSECEDIELHKLEEKNLPDTITANQMTAIVDLIEE